MYSNSELMLHEPLIPVTGGSTSSICSTADRMVKTRQRVNMALAKHSGCTFESINKATEYDHFFYAEEAVSAGFCDEIIHGLGGDEQNDR